MLTCDNDLDRIAVNIPAMPKWRSFIQSAYVEDRLAEFAKAARESDDARTKEARHVIEDYAGALREICQKLLKRFS